jgi:hypothetical protein
MAVAHPHREPTGWVGWVVFASVILMMVGAFQAIAGLTAIFNDDYFLVNDSGLVLELDYTAWGWIHLVLGIGVILAGVSILRGHMYGRIIGVIAASLSALANLAFLSAYPVWTVLMIALDVIVIHALVVHGSELQES